MKKWIVRQPKKDFSERIIKEAGITSLCADVLASRGFETAEEASEKFFSCELSDPFLLKDMTEAAELINQALDNGDRICIYGDYDCDGITSTVMLYSYLETMGADVFYRLPERSEGYGLNSEVVHEISQHGAKLIITVDNGISAYSESELIYELGMKLIITDHHQPGETLPKAEAIVNPHRKDCPSIFKKLCGAGVVLKLIAALEGGNYETALNEYCELAAIGTVADIVELSGENRFIVSRGIELMEVSQRFGINALIQKSGLKKPLTSTSLAFGIAPRINASGRFGSPKLAARLLLTDVEEEAEMLCTELDRLNESRKKTENEIVDAISEYISNKPEVTYNRAMVFSGENWHHGVIGIVASRMVERFDKPCFIITVEGDIARGSARAFGDYSIYKALDYCKDILLKYGGHMGAGGFSLETENIPEFEKLIAEFSEQNFSSMPVQEIIADKLIQPWEITMENIEDLKVLQPYGAGNPQPVFAILGAEIMQITPLSKGAHTKLKLKYGNIFLDVLLFRYSPDEIFLHKGERADFMVTLETQVYNGKKSISVIVKDFRKSGMEQSKFFAARDAYEKFRRKETLSEAYYKRMCPDRQELIPVYKQIALGKCSMETLYMSVQSESMNYCKLCVCTDVFDELGLININRFTQEINVIKNAPKADLESSSILTELRNKC